MTTTPNAVVSWGSSFWLVLTDEHFEMAGAGDVPPETVTADDIALLMGLQRHELVAEDLEAPLREAVERRGFTAATADQAQAEPPWADGDWCAPDARISWRTRPTFRIVDGHVVGWSTTRRELVRLRPSQIRVLVALTKQAEVGALCAGDPEAPAALGGLCTHGFIEADRPLITADAFSAASRIADPVEAEDQGGDQDGDEDGDRNGDREEAGTEVPQETVTDEPRTDEAPQEGSPADEDPSVQPATDQAPGVEIPPETPTTEPIARRLRRTTRRALRKMGLRRPAWFVRWQVSRRAGGDHDA